MDATNFCYWLQGYIELSGPHLKSFSSPQVQEIKNHLNLVVAPQKSVNLLPYKEIEKALSLSEKTYC